MENILNNINIINNRKIVIETKNIWDTRSYDDAEKIISNMRSTNIRLKYSNQPLLHFFLTHHKISEDDKFKIVQLLIKRKTDVTIKDEDENTPLHYIKSVKTAQLLLDNGADLEAKNKKGYTPLVKLLIDFGPYAIDATPVDLQLFYINKGADISFTDKEGRNLIYYTSFDNIKVMKALLDKNPNFINHTDNLGNTPLHYNKSFDILGIFLKAKPELINAKNNFDENPIMLAVKDFIVHDVKHYNTLEQSGYQKKYQQYYHRLICWLKEHGAKASIVNRAGYSAISFVAENEQYDKLLTDLKQYLINGKGPFCQYGK